MLKDRDTFLDWKSNVKIVIFYIYCKSCYSVGWDIMGGMWKLPPSYKSLGYSYAYYPIILKRVLLSYIANSMGSYYLTPMLDSTSLTLQKIWFVFIPPWGILLSFLTSFLDIYMISKWLFLDIWHALLVNIC